MTRYNLRKIARAFVHGDELAIEYHKQLAKSAAGKQNKIWSDIAGNDILRKLRLW